MKVKTLLGIGAAAFTFGYVTAKDRTANNNTSHNKITNTIGNMMDNVMDTVMGTTNNSNNTSTNNFTNSSANNSTPYTAADFADMGSTTTTFNTANKNNFTGTNVTSTTNKPNSTTASTNTSTTTNHSSYSVTPNASATNGTNTSSNNSKGTMNTSSAPNMTSNYSPASASTIAKGHNFSLDSSQIEKLEKWFNKNIQNITQTEFNHELKSLDSKIEKCNKDMERIGTWSSSVNTPNENWVVGKASLGDIASQKENYEEIREAIIKLIKE